MIIFSIKNFPQFQKDDFDELQAKTLSFTFNVIEIFYLVKWIWQYFSEIFLALVELVLKAKKVFGSYSPELDDYTIRNYLCPVVYFT